jgi:hypothetical protein
VEDLLAELWIASCTRKEVDYVKTLKGFVPV